MKPKLSTRMNTTNPNEWIKVWINAMQRKLGKQILWYGPYDPLQFKSFDLKSMTEIINVGSWFEK